jgi:predicted amidohydrolase
MKDTRVAAVAVNPRMGDLAAMEESLAAWTRKAARERADVVIFPEGILTTYDVPGIAKCAVEVDSAVMGRLRKMAEEAGIIVSVGFLERSEKGFHVSNVHLGRGVFHLYRKCHLTAEEKPLCVPGETLSVQALATATFGTMICYDSAFPRAAKTLVDRGAHVLVHSSCHAFYEKGEPRDYAAALARRRNHVLKYWRARAYDLSCYGVQVDNVGEAANGQWFPGYTAIFGPDGEVMGEAANGKEEMVVADLTAQALYKARAGGAGHFCTLSDARPELYTP